MITHQVKQGNPEWQKLRLGIPTASEFDEIITPKGTPRTGEGPSKYLYRKLCEKVMGFSSDQGSSWAMGQGSILEHEAIPWLEFTHDLKVDRIGFCTTDDGLIGCSPDGLIGYDAGLEVKCPQPETHLRYLMEGKLPTEYVMQVQGGMFVTGRPKWYFLSYNRQFPALFIEVKRDDLLQTFISEALKNYYEIFDSRLAKITAMRAAENALQEAANKSNANL
jgi:hypothetical protein